MAAVNGSFAHGQGWRNGASIRWRGTAACLGGRARQRRPDRAAAVLDPLFRTGDAAKSRRAASAASADVLHRLLADLLTAVADFSADPAMLVLAGVAPAFLSTYLAGRRADLKHLPQDLPVGAGGGARIGAVEIEPDALPELLHHPLGIGTGGTRLCTGVASSTSPMMLSSCAM